MRNYRSTSNRNTRRENPRQNYGRYNQNGGREGDRRERNREYKRGYERDNDMDLDREYYNDYMSFREDNYEDENRYDMQDNYISDYDEFESDIRNENMEERDRDRDWDDYYNGREYDEDYRGVGHRQPGKRSRFEGNTNSMRNRESRPYNEGRWPEARESRFRDNSGYGGRDSYGYGERYRRDPREDSRDFREYDRYGRNRAFQGGSPGDNMREGYFHRDYSDDRMARPNYSFDQESSRRPRRRFRR